MRRAQVPFQEGAKGFCVWKGRGQEELVRLSHSSAMRFLRSYGCLAFSFDLHASVSGHEVQSANGMVGDGACQYLRASQITRMAVAQTAATHVVKEQSEQYKSGRYTNTIGFL